MSILELYDYINGKTGTRRLENHIHFPRRIVVTTDNEMKVKENIHKFWGVTRDFLNNLVYIGRVPISRDRNIYFKMEKEGINPDVLSFVRYIFTGDIRIQWNYYEILLIFLSSVDGFYITIHIFDSIGRIINTITPDHFNILEQYIDNNVDKKRISGIDISYDKHQKKNKHISLIISSLNMINDSPSVITR